MNGIVAALMIGVIALIVRLAYLKSRGMGYASLRIIPVVFLIGTLSLISCTNPSDEWDELRTNGVDDNKQSINSSKKAKAYYLKAIKAKGLGYSKDDFVKSVISADKEAVDLFIKSGMDVNTVSDEGWNLLYIAVGYEHDAIVELLLANDADVNAQNPPHGLTPLHSAVYGDAVLIVELLIKNGANVNALDDDRGFTPLHIAALKGYSIIFELLLINGANINARIKSGLTALTIVKSEINGRKNKGEDMEEFTKIFNLLQRNNAIQ